MKCKTIVPGIALSLGLIISAGARADVMLTLQNPGSTSYQQTQNSPCVIGESSCNNPAGFGEGLIPNGSATSYNVASPTYTVSQIQQILNSNTFMVGIDVNTTTQPLATEQLQLFQMAVNDGGTITLFTYQDLTLDSGTGFVGTQLYTNNNGNGYSDELLTGFTLNGFSADALVTFTTIVNNPTDGKEEFFLIATQDGGGGSNGIPEPGTVAVLGLGLALIGVSHAARAARR